MTDSGFGVITLVDPLYDESRQDGPWFARGPRFERFVQSDRGRKLLTANVLVDGHPLGPINYFGPSSHSVPTGRHR